MVLMTFLSEVSRWQHSTSSHHPLLLSRSLTLSLMLHSWGRRTLVLGLTLMLCWHLILCHLMNLSSLNESSLLLGKSLMLGKPLMMLRLMLRSLVVSALIWDLTLKLC